MEQVPLKTEEEIRDYYSYSVFIRVIAGLSIVWFDILSPLSELGGRGIAELDRVQYSEGILNVSYQKVLKGSDYNVLLLKEQNSNQWTEYYCGYSARHFARANWCFTDEQIEPYKNKHAKIGWYYQDRFLWLKNPHPQLVSLQVDGKEIRSYEQTKNLSERYKKSGVYLEIGLSIFVFIGFGFMYLIGELLGRHCKKMLKEREVVL